MRTRGVLGFLVCSFGWVAFDACASKANEAGTSADAGEVDVVDARCGSPLVGRRVDEDAGCKTASTADLGCPSGGKFLPRLSCYERVVAGGVVERFFSANLLPTPPLGFNECSPDVTSRIIQYPDCR